MLHAEAEDAKRMEAKLRYLANNNEAKLAKAGENKLEPLQLPKEPMRAAVEPPGSGRRI